MRFSTMHYKLDCSCSVQQWACSIHTDRIVFHSTLFFYYLAVPSVICSVSPLFRFAFAWCGVQPWRRRVHVVTRWGGAPCHLPPIQSSCGPVGRCYQAIACVRSVHRHHSCTRRLRSREKWRHSTSFCVRRHFCPRGFLKIQYNNTTPKKVFLVTLLKDMSKHPPVKTLFLVLYFCILVEMHSTAL